MFELKCRNAGFDCAGVIQADTKDEVLRLAAAHALEVHKTKVDDAMAKQLAPLIQSVPAAPRG